MFQRNKFTYKVQLQRADGTLLEADFETYWSPEFEGIEGQVGASTAARLWYDSDKQQQFAPLTVIKPEVTDAAAA